MQATTKSAIHPGIGQSWLGEGHQVDEKNDEKAKGLPLTIYSYKFHYYEIIERKIEVKLHKDAILRSVFNIR